MADYYEILGVPKDASSDDIRQAYRKLAMKYHPDRNQGDKASETKFKEVSNAYDVLSDDEKRQRYDLTGSATSPVGGEESYGSMDDLLNIFKKAFSGTDEPSAHFFKKP